MKNSLFLMFLFLVGVANAQSASKMATTAAAAPVQPMLALPMPSLASATLEIEPLLRISRSFHCWFEISSVSVLSNGIPAQYNDQHIEPHKAWPCLTEHLGFFHGALLSLVKRAQHNCYYCGFESPTMSMPYRLQCHL